MGINIRPWQRELAEALWQSRNNLPNGLLIYGPRGIGTIDLVIDFARSLFCESPSEDGTPCGLCKGCKMAQAKTHPDLRYVFSEAEAITYDVPFDAPSNAAKDRKIYREILIHQPRELADFLNLAPHVENGLRVVIVYPADMIRADAAATFLKSLEEPPEKTTFLMVSDDLDRVLPTIRSRCRLLRAKAPTQEQALSWLKTQGIEQAQDALARAGGRPCLVTNENFIRQSDHIDSKTREQLLTLTTISPESRAHLMDLLSLGAKINLSDLAIKEGRSAVPVSAVLPILEQWGYDLLLIKNGLTVRYFPAYEKQMLEIVRAIDWELLFKWCDSLKQVKRVITHPLNAQLVVEQCLLNYRRMCQNQSFD